jgi:hypothetical protein
LTLGTTIKANVAQLSGILIETLSYVGRMLSYHIKIKQSGLIYHGLVIAIQQATSL